jgi:hypothetical protein
MNYFLWKMLKNMVYGKKITINLFKVYYYEGRQ